MTDAPLPGRAAADAFPLRAGRLPAAFDRDLTQVVLASLARMADRFHEEGRLDAADALYDAALGWACLSRDPVEAAVFAGALARAALRLQRRRHARRLALARGRRRPRAKRPPRPEASSS
jgi:hypothetical protein